MEVIRKTMSPMDKAQLENAEAQAEKNKADIFYIAMMTDVDLDDDEEGNTNE